MNGTWPPTTATEGRASQRDIPSPPWSPKTVQARWILLTRPIKLCIVAIFGIKIYEFIDLIVWRWKLNARSDLLGPDP